MPRIPGLVDWYAVLKYLMHGKPRLRPWEIERMTMAEIGLACDQDLEKTMPPARGRTFRDKAERDAWLVKLRGMTAAERLELARETYR